MSSPGNSERSSTPVVCFPNHDEGAIELLGSFVPQILRGKCAKLDRSGASVKKGLVFPPPYSHKYVAGILDINGMTTLAHDFCDDPEEAADLVNTLFEKIFFSIEDYGGDVIKLVGDALVCLWKPVFDDPEDEKDAMCLACVQAVKCFLEIFEGLDQNVALKEVLKCHAGIGLGYVNIMHVGSEETFSFFCNGEAFQMAAKALDLSFKGQCVMGADVTSYLKIQGKSRKLAHDIKPCEANGDFTWIGLDDPNDVKAFRRRNTVSFRSIGRVGLDDINEHLKHKFPDLLLDEDSIDASVVIPALQKYVPGNIVRRLMDSGGSEIGFRSFDEMRDVTTVFVNFFSFNASSKNQKEAEALLINTQSLFMHILECLKRDDVDGMLRQFIVDDRGCVLIVCFGTPTNDFGLESNCERAIKFALMLKNVVHYCPHSTGIATGKCFCGVVGSDYRKNYCILGDSIRLAAQLADVGMREDCISDSATVEGAGKESLIVEDLMPTKVSGLGIVTGLKRPKLAAKPKVYDVLPDEADHRFTGRSAQKMQFIDALYGNKVVLLTSGEGTGKSEFLQHSSAVAKEIGFSSYISNASANFVQAYFTLRLVVKNILRIERAGWDDLSSASKLSHITQQIGAVVEKCSNEHKGEGAGRRASSLDHDQIMSSLSSIFKVRNSFSGKNTIPEEETAELIAEVLNPSSKMMNSAVASSGTVLGSSIDKQGGNNGGRSGVDVTADSNSGNMFSKKMAVHPAGGSSSPYNSDPEDNSGDAASHSGSQASAVESLNSHSHSITSSHSRVGAGGMTSKDMRDTFQALSVRDVLCLVQSNMDLGVTAPLTKAIQEMSIIYRSQILAKFLFHLLSAQERCVIFIDDVQFLDPSSWKLLEKLSKRCNHLCLVLSGDAGKLESSNAAAAFTNQIKKIKNIKRSVVIDLPNFSRDEVGAAAANICTGMRGAGAAWPDHVLDLIYESTQGHPKESSNIVNALLREKKVVWEGGELSVSDSDSIRKVIKDNAAGSQSAILDRYGALDEIGREIVNGASVFEEHFSIDILTELLPFALKRDRSLPEKTFNALCDMNWFIADNFEDRAYVAAQKNSDIGHSFLAARENGSTAKTFSFTEPKTQKIVYGLLDEEKKKTTHIQCLRSLRTYFEDDLQSMFPVLALHAFKGGNKEDEIFLLHKAAADSLRLGLLEDAEKKFTRILVLAQTSKFKKFDKVTAEQFTIPIQKASWNLSLAECRYILGKIDLTKTNLLAACDLLEVDTNVHENAAESVKEIKKCIKALGWELSALGGHSKLKVDAKLDTMAKVKYRVLGRLFVISALDLDEKKFLEYGSIFLKSLLEENTRQANLIACFLVLLLRCSVDSGIVLGKWIGVIEQTAFACFSGTKESKRDFKQISWAGLNTLLSTYLCGKDVAKAASHASDAYGSFQMLNSSTGQLESMICMYNCEQALNSTYSHTVERNSGLVRKFGDNVGNSLAHIWASSFSIKKGRLVHGCADADEMGRIKQIVDNCRRYTKIHNTDLFEPESGAEGSGLGSKPKSVQLEAWVCECVAALKVQESSEVAYECAIEGLNIIQGSPITVFSGFLKEAYFVICETFLFVYKEKIDSERNPEEGSGVGKGEHVHAQLSDIGCKCNEALACCEKLAKHFPAFTTRLKAIKEIHRFYLKNAKVNGVVKTLRKLGEDAEKAKMQYDCDWIKSHYLEFEKVD